MSGKTFLISVFCPDKTGLVAGIAGALFELGGDLGDTTFAVLGGGAEFNAVTEFPDDVEQSEIEAALAAAPELDGARVEVMPFELAARHGESGTITHRIELSGGNRPGLIARVAEAFVQYKVNVVRLNAERVPGRDDYVIRLAVWIPKANMASCLATINNTAGELGLNCRWESA